MFIECFKCGWPNQNCPFSHRNMKIVAPLVVNVPDSIGITVIHLLFVVTLIHLNICKIKKKKTKKKKKAN